MVIFIRERRHVDVITISDMNSSPMFPEVYPIPDSELDNSLSSNSSVLSNLCNKHIDYLKTTFL